MKHLLTSLVVFCSSSLVLIAVLESGFRLLHPIPQYGSAAGLLQANDDYEFGLTPNFTGFHNSPDFTSTIRTNALGLRDDPNLTYDSDRQTILVIGDSAFEGYGLDSSDSVANVFERHIDQSVFRVVNASVRGWATRHELLYLIHEGYKYQPAYIFVVFTENDLHNNAATASIYKGLLLPSPLDDITKLEVDGFLLARRSHLFRFLYYEAYFNRRTTDFSDVNDRFLEAVTREEYFAAFQQYALSMQAEADTLKAQLAFILQPWLKSYQLDKNYTRSAGVLAIHEKVKHVLATNHLQYIDLSEDMMSAQAEGDLYFAHADGHLNQAGSLAVGRALARRFQQRYPPVLGPEGPPRTTLPQGG